MRPSRLVDPGGWSCDRTVPFWAAERNRSGDLPGSSPILAATSFKVSPSGMVRRWVLISAPRSSVWRTTPMSSLRRRVNSPAFIESAPLNRA
jgi:hypothetical protein